MNDNKQRGRPRKQEPSDVVGVQVSQIIDSACAQVSVAPDDAKESIHQVLGKMTEILTAPQGAKRTGFKW